MGKVNLCYLLNENGHVLSEATIAKLEDERYWYGSAAGSEWHDRDWISGYMPASVSLTELAGSHTVLVVAGPQARALLQSLSPREDWSNAAFPWMHVRPMLIGDIRALVMRVSFSGELGYDLHVPNEYLHRCWDTIDRAGGSFDLAPFGLYATESMRLEKGYRHWKADLTYEFNPMEAALERFVDLNKRDFVGKSALLEQIRVGLRKRFVTLVIDCDIAPAHEGDPVYHQDRLIGSVTSGGFGHRVNKNIAFAYVDKAHAKPDTPMSVEVLGSHRRAEMVERCLFDPDNRRLRA